MTQKYKDIRIGQIFIELTNLCNFNCEFCPNDKMTRERASMDPKLAKRLIDEISSNGISRKVVFCLMGEPLLYPHIFEILQYAADRDIKITLSTNGALLSKEGNIDKLLSIPLDILQVSLQTPTAGSFRLRRGSPSLTYEKYIDGIKALIRKKLESKNSSKLSILFMDTGFVLSQLFLNGRNTLGIKFDRREEKELVSGLSAYIDSLEGLSLRPVNSPFSLMGNLSINIQRFLLGSYKKKFGGRIEFCFSGMHNWGDIMVGDRVMPAIFGSCNALTDQFAVLSNGDYSLCCKDYNGDLAIGNAYRQSLMEILTSDKAQKIKRDFRLCRLSFKRCRICRGGTNTAELALKQIFTSIVYNIPFIFKPLKKLALR